MLSLNIFYSFHHNGYVDTVQLTDIVERDWKKSLKLIQFSLPYAC